MQFKDREKELQQRGKNGQSREEVAGLMSNYDFDAHEKTNELKELLVSTFVFEISNSNMCAHAHKTKP